MCEKDSILLAHDAAPMGNQFLMLKEMITHRHGIISSQEQNPRPQWKLQDSQSG